jgi:hypothetical protein
MSKGKNIRLYMVLLSTVVFVCCSHIFGPDFVISETSRNYLSFFKPNDTLYFQDLKGKIDTFLITYIDSEEHTETNLSSLSPWKEVRVHYKQLPKNLIKDSILVSIFASYRSQVSINFKDFVYSPWVDGKLADGAKNQQGVLMHDTIMISKKNFTGYFDFGYSRGDSSKMDSTDITHLYWLNKYGIIAYKYRNGNMWKRINLPN